MTHDIVVIGASAGGVELLLDLAGELPADLPASVFVVIHTAPGFASALPELLAARGPLPAEHPVHGAPIAPSRIYVAPADSHLLVRHGYVEVVRGPRENGHRPAVDPLFRSASWAYGARVIGVVLSGHQDCGTAGMMSVKARGGVAVVQDPASAVAPDMPRSVLSRVAVDHVVQPAELPGLLARLVRQPAADTAAPPPAAIDVLEGRRNGERAELVCPACHGVLTEAGVGGFRHFRCHVGHAFSLESLVGEQGEEVERALWSAVRSLEEGAALARRLTRTQDPDLRRRFGERQRDLMTQADLLRRILLRGTALDEGGAEEEEAGASGAGPEAAGRDPH